jgi:hypothetical protein
MNIPAFSDSLKGWKMSRDSMLLLASGAVVIAVMVLYYDNHHIGVKGIGKGRPVAAAMRNSVADDEQTDNDNNSIDQIITAAGKSGKGAKKAPPKPQITKEQFVAFDAWPSASNNCPNKPEELPTQDANQESKNSGELSSAATSPQSALDDELKSTSELYKGLADRLDKQGLAIMEYNLRVRRLQTEYDEKIKLLFQKRQKLDATQKLIGRVAQISLIFVASQIACAKIALCHGGQDYDGQTTKR